MTGNLPRKLQPDEFGKRCSPESFDADCSLPEPGDELIGQERAVRSLKFGLDVSRPGYNIFMAGSPGTGKSTFARTAVGRKAEEMETPQDWCYVYNFNDANNPWALSLPAGEGAVFKKDMEELIEDVRTAVRNEIEGGNFEKRRHEIIEEFQRKTSETLRALEDEVREHGFTVQRGTGGFAPVPLGEDGTPMSNEEFQALQPEKKHEIEEKGNEVQGIIRKATRQVRQLEKEVKASIRELERQVGSFAIQPLIEQMQEKHQGSSRVCEYLDLVHEDMIEHLDQFKSDDEDESQGQMLLMGQRPQADLTRYKVNLLVNNADTEGAPMIDETNPTYYNLFGKLEYESNMGTMITNHTLIRPGALHRANGGFIILRAEDVLVNAGTWEALKRTLKGDCIRVENIGEQYRLVPTTAVKPEPIPLNTKIILIGSPVIYYLLSAYDDDFRKFFKVKADFDVQMPRNERYLEQYSRFVQNVSARDDLLPLANHAVARIVDHSSRLTHDQTKLSARFNEVVEIIYEADAWAREDDVDCIEAEHVDKAVREKIYRSRLVEDHIRESIDRGKIFVDIDGKVVGQINGLSVLNLGDYSFGHPSRITANVYMGDEGVVNVERQVKMSGSTHSKGVFILSSYLAQQFAYDKPLSLSASITFEQLYSGVDGDSASSAELYAIISSLANVPLRQDIAVTGSMNQKGQVQPVGGINEKIEGFYYTCKARGLTGEQGVAIPAKNLDNLMLNDEVIEAAEEGQFHVWIVENVQEGIELLTGMPAGEREDDGQFPDGSVFGKADQRLREMGKAMRKFSGSSPDDAEDSERDDDKQ